MHQRRIVNYTFKEISTNLIIVGMTALVQAAKHNDTDVILKLIDAGADHKITSYEGLNILHYFINRDLLGKFPKLINQKTCGGIFLKINFMKSFFFKS